MRCWIAPRDVRDGEPFVEEIVAGIRECPVFVLVHTPRSDASSHVMRELTQAAGLRRRILAVRAEVFPTSPAMRYYLDPVQALVCSSLEDDAALAAITARVRRLLAGDDGTPGSRPGPMPDRALVPDRPRRAGARRAIVVGIAAAAAVALAVGVRRAPNGPPTRPPLATNDTAPPPTPPGGFPDPTTCFPSRPRREEVEAYAPPLDAADCTLDYVNHAGEPLRLRLYDWGLHYTSADGGDAPWQEFPFPATGASKPCNDLAPGKGWFSCGVVDHGGGFHYLGEVKVFDRPWTTIVVERDGGLLRWRVSQRD